MNSLAQCSQKAQSCYKEKSIYNERCKIVPWKCCQSIGGQEIEKSEFSCRTRYCFFQDQFCPRSTIHSQVQKYFLKSIILLLFILSTNHPLQAIFMIYWLSIYVSEYDISGPSHVRQRKKSRGCVDVLEKRTSSQPSKLFFFFFLRKCTCVKQSFGRRAIAHSGNLLSQSVWASTTTQNINWVA